MNSGKWSKDKILVLQAREPLIRDVGSNPAFSEHIYYSFASLSTCFPAAFLTCTPDDSRSRQARYIIPFDVVGGISHQKEGEVV